MKIIVDYNQDELQTVSIKNAKYLGDFVIRIKFNDGVEKLVDFKTFLKGARHPSIKKYCNEKLFSNYLIVDGNLNWNDYDMIFPIGDLYKGKIEM